MSSSSYNLRNPAVKRLMKEAAELRSPSELYFAQPLDDNLFEWHFTVRGPPDSDFEGGLYHGRISLPPQYPMRPPSIMLLTPNGRFELSRKICLSISGHHPESWQPSWSIRTALLAMIGFMPSHGGGAIGSLDYPAPERRALAAKSADWACGVCGLKLKDALPPLTGASATEAQEANSLASQIAFKDETQTKAEAAAEGAAPDTQPEDEAMEEEEPEMELRHRFPERHATTTMGEADSGPSSWVTTLLIALVAAVIAALLARRLYMSQEWRFHTPPS